MISKNIECKPENDNYQALAKYVGAANQEAEKLLHRWHVGCQCDDFANAITEVCATQDMNTRTTREKTYHLLVSVNSEDDAKLSCQDWQDIEAAFAEVLGLSEHQRHCGIHNNTANTHMHVAYNLIHPQTFNRHDPYGDYYKRTRLCRELEKRYGLRIDVQEVQKEHTAFPQGPIRKNEKAATMEAHTGQQSFDSYIQEHKATITAGLDRAASWEDVHTCLATLGLEIQIVANGCIIKDCYGKHRAKASSIGRAYSKLALEKRFGAFTPRNERLANAETDRYAQKPLQRLADSDGLYHAYQAGMAERKAVLAAVNDEYRCEMVALQKRTVDNLSDIKRSWILLPKDKVTCIADAQLKNLKSQEKIRAAAQEKRKALREKVPYTSWSEFLQWQANKGNIKALERLQQRKEAGKIEAEPIAASEALQRKSPMRTDWQKKIYEAYANPLLVHTDKHNLITFYRMHQLAETEALAHDFTHRIDHRGTALIRFKNGMTIKDDGKEIIFSARDEEEKRVAITYATLRFGKNAQVCGNRITNGPVKSNGIFNALFGRR